MDDWIAREGRSLVPRERLRALSVKSDLRGALQALSHGGAIAATTCGLLLVAPAAPWTLVPLLFAQGVLINCLYAGQHELSHWTVFRAKWVNDAVGQLFGFATLNPFLTDRFLHFGHHRATHDPERDPELIGLAPYDLAGYLLDFTAVTFWWRRITGVLSTAGGGGLSRVAWLTARERAIVTAEAQIYAGLWGAIAAASLLTQSWAAVVFWLGPLLTTKWVHQLQNMGEHTGLPHEPDLFVSTRTLDGPPPMRWLMWNMSWHTAHHCFPAVPFHALPALHREIAGRRPVIVRGYIAAQRDIYAALAAHGRI